MNTNIEERTVPYVVYEIAEMKHERTLKRLILALIITIVLMFVSNALWLHEWVQYDYGDLESQDIEVKSLDGVANYIGNNGAIDNGLYKSNKN